MLPSFKPRGDIIDFIRRTLMGPVGGAAETLDGTPLLRYMTGILFPRGSDVGETENAITATAEDDGLTVNEDPDVGGTEAGLQLSSEELPSAVGISFRVPDHAVLDCTVSAAVYEEVAEARQGRDRSGRRWTRKGLGEDTSGTGVEISKSTISISIWDGRARLVSRWRSSTDGTAIVTVALVNSQVAELRTPDPSRILFQAQLRCKVRQGLVLRYPQVSPTHEDHSEESEISFLYRGVPIFARGHGAAANWGGVSESGCEWVAVDFVPAVDVPRASFELVTKDVDPHYSSLQFLVSGSREAVLGALESLVAAYRDWVSAELTRAEQPGNPAAALRLAKRAASWLKRMETGLALLTNDDLAWRSFRLANEAMSIQMSLVRARPKSPHKREHRANAPVLDHSGKYWRPFQIAFLLASIESLVVPGAKDRDIIDVIWFPTGGGKTEAYLLVSAFELIRRRLEFGEQDKATAIISRYTLRFLTAQQFQRTAALIIALERIRRRANIGLGERPFSLGLWVGRKVTPNSFAQAHELLEQQLGANVPKNPFLLDACPWCGTAIFPSSGSRPDDFGVKADLRKFEFHCPNDTCDFHESLPLNVVDEGLYLSPASLLLGTIDKFAQLPWDDRARVFFGGPTDDSPPPSLILQDELHLIAGPLGSLSAPYDAAIDVVIRLRGGHAKRICSTATIRNAREQVRGLYGGPVSVFPPPCSTWDNAFFFGTDRDKPGRTYLGVMGQGYIKPVVAMAWTSAALLQATSEIPLDTKTLDSYWTVLAYHNSRRELGRTLSAARDEVQARIKAIASTDALARQLGEPLELSAQMVKSLGEALQALETPHQAQQPAVDFVPCTSIISVGVDIDRLGVMLVNGQPKLVSEYIQATSRVGRSSVPGLVVSLFAATKPRDRSHYEDFRAFHESIYRHVEPTSVTPYSLPARERTLHAALISAVRHATPFGRNDAAKLIDFDDPLVRQSIAELRRIMRASDPAEGKEIDRLLDSRIDEWKEMSASGMSLLYEARNAGMGFQALLAEYGKSQGGNLWPTMNSMRSVDAEVGLKLG